MSNMLHMNFVINVKTKMHTRLRTNTITVKKSLKQKIQKTIIKKQKQKNEEFRNHKN